ncbi:MAG: hypothetical protein LWY06_12080 [Firmicutes bacterium]|nr:hypothetical protein [Bacillota bacterium]
MIIISHRVNKITELENTPAKWGAEIDIRDYDGKLRLTHEPFDGGDDLEEYIRKYKHNTLVFNVKCDGLESRIIDLADKYGIIDYFFLDTPVPTSVKLTRMQNSRFAVRYSEYEPIEAALAFKGLADWVWIDTFSGRTPDEEDCMELGKHFKTCLVSPELQGYSEETIKEFADFADKTGISAVCTDFCQIWEDLMNRGK